MMILTKSSTRRIIAIVPWEDEFGLDQAEGGGEGIRGPPLDRHQIEFAGVFACQLASTIRVHGQGDADQA